VTAAEHIDEVADVFCFAAVTDHDGRLGFDDDHIIDVDERD
jgi:hypothetical protein